MSRFMVLMLVLEDRLDRSERVSTETTDEEGRRTREEVLVDESIGLLEFSFAEKMSDVESGEFFWIDIGSSREYGFDSVSMSVGTVLFAFLEDFVEFLLPNFVCFLLFRLDFRMSSIERV